MADTAFFSKKYSISEMVSQYLKDIQKLRPLVKTPSDENKLQSYHQAASTFLHVSTNDIFQLVRSYGREPTGKSAAMRQAFPTLLGDRISAPSELDLAYLHLLLAYATEFKLNRANLKEWLLRFIFSSQYSPLLSFIDREINDAIANTQAKIASMRQLT